MRPWMRLGILALWLFAELAGLGLLAAGAKSRTARRSVRWTLGFAGSLLMAVAVLPLLDLAAGHTS